MSKRRAELDERGRRRPLNTDSASRSLWVGGPLKAAPVWGGLRSAAAPRRNTVLVDKFVPGPSG